MVLLIDLQTVAVSINEICIGWDDINRITRHHYHFFGAELCRTWDVLRIVGLGDPD